MLTFQQRRDTILSQFAQAKADLETLNSDIDAEIEKNKSVISTLTSKNTELASLKSNNEGSIKTFAKSPKIIIINPINNQLLPVWLDRLSRNYHASLFFFSLQVESSTLHTLHGGRYYKESFCSCKMPLL